MKSPLQKLLMHPIRPPRRKKQFQFKNTQLSTITSKRALVEWQAPSAKSIISLYQRKAIIPIKVSTQSISIIPMLLQNNYKSGLNSSRKWGEISNMQPSPTNTLKGLLIQKDKWRISLKQGLFPGPRGLLSTLTKLMNLYLPLPLIKDMKPTPTAGKSNRILLKESLSIR